MHMILEIDFALPNLLRFNGRTFRNIDALTLCSHISRSRMTYTYPLFVYKHKLMLMNLNYGSSYRRNVPKELACFTYYTVIDAVFS